MKFLTDFNKWKLQTVSNTTKLDFLRIILNLSQVSKRGLAVTAARRADQVMPDPVEHATGEI